MEIKIPNARLIGKGESRSYPVRDENGQPTDVEGGRVMEVSFSDGRMRPEKFGPFAVFNGVADAFAQMPLGTTGDLTLRLFQHSYEKDGVERMVMKVDLVDFA